MVGSLERMVLRDFLITYRNLPCLWDQNDELYSNRPAREQAYGILLEKLVKLEPDATIDMVRKKIDTFRTGFKRELKKVYERRHNPDECEYTPSLWYFKLLLFLDKKSGNDGRMQTDELLDDDDDIFVETETIKAEHPIEEFLFEESPPQAKKNKKNSSFVLLNNDMGVQESSKDELESVKEDPNSEAELYGRTVGLQLKALDPLQKTIAEKIISEVIFYGRLNKLTVDSTLQVNEDF